jgi:ABC-type transporter Mla maintaining outer membrane lipid asymmetry permease subunit MlaE
MNQRLSRPIDRILVLSFLIASFLYIIIVVNPVFWFHKMQPAFLTTTDFFRNYLNHPGGFSEWVSNLVMQTFQFTIVGSIVLFAFVLVLAFLTFNILKQFKKNAYVGFKL